MFGKKCEVLIHDFSNPQHSIVAIENGHVTGRKIGNPITDFALSIWKKNGYKNKNTDRIVNYKTKTKDGKILKSSTVFIRDNQKKIIGCICINYDLTEHSMFHKGMDEFCTTVGLDKKKSEIGWYAFRLYAEGKVIMQPKLYLELPEYRVISALPAFIDGSIVLKWLCAYLNNKAQGLPGGMTTIFYVTLVIGPLLAIINGIHINNMRTGTAGGVAIRCLAKKDSSD